MYDRKQALITQNVKTPMFANSEIVPDFRDSRGFPNPGLNILIGINLTTANKGKTIIFIGHEIKCKHKAWDCKLSIKIQNTMRWIQNNTKPCLSQILISSFDHQLLQSIFPIDITGVRFYQVLWVTDSNQSKTSRKSFQQYELWIRPPFVQWNQVSKCITDMKTRNLLQTKLPIS
jgi:hypothetical protein